MRENLSLKVCHSVRSLSTGCLTILVDDEEELDEKDNVEKEELTEAAPADGSQTSIRLATPPGVAPVISTVAHSTQVRRCGCLARSKCLRLLTCMVGARFFTLSLSSFSNAGKDAWITPLMSYPRSGPICYMAADTRLFLQEYRIVLPARASAVEEKIRCLGPCGELELSEQKLRKRFDSQELRKCGSAWSGQPVPGMRRFLGHGHERCGQAVEDDRGRGKRGLEGRYGRHFKVLEPLY